jgi:sulfate adenylyltransferase large subunit
MHAAALRTAPPAAQPSAAAAEKSLLRFLTCGSVDDGKSTLIGRMLYDARLVPDDALEVLEADSRKHGTNAGRLDYALLVDGLAAEREQGITIDVAYRYFATERRKFIVADTPGHEQYTRNMATGASTADLAVLLIDARKGLLAQTRRHSIIVSMLGVRHVVLAVNKMDLADYSAEVFLAIEHDYRRFAANLGFTSITAIPLVARDGDNIVFKSQHMSWYRGPSLLTHLEQAVVDTEDSAAPFRMPVQWVNRPSPDFRGFSGTIAAGSVKAGERIRILPSGLESRVARIVTADGDLSSAAAGQSVTLTLADEIDVSRGAVIASAARPPKVADRLRGRLLWVGQEPLMLGKVYILKLGTQQIPAHVRTISARIGIETGAGELPGGSLSLNETGVAEISLDRPAVCDQYGECRETGGYILIDRLTNETVAAGFVEEAELAPEKQRENVEASHASMEGLPQPVITPLRERSWRSLLKSISWRVTGSLGTFILSLLFTGNLKISAAISGTEIFTKIILYYLHERAWGRLNIGLFKPQGSDKPVKSRQEPHPSLHAG